MATLKKKTDTNRLTSNKEEQIAREGGKSIVNEVDTTIQWKEGNGYQ